MTVQSNAPLLAQLGVSRRVAYSIAAGAVVGSATDAEALIVYSGIEDISIELGNFQSLQFDADEYVDVYLRNYFYANPVPHTYQGMKVEFANGRFVGKRVNNLNYVRALAAGYEINATNVDYVSGSLANGDLNPNAEFRNVQNAFIGVGFPISGDGSPDNYFGWIRVSIDNEAGSFVVHEWAYEDVLGTPIRAGDRGAAGDFNDDGIVDAVDYTVWRNSLNTNFDLAGHGDEVGDSLGIVDEEDYILWKAAYGWTAPPGTGSGGAALAAPEPTTLGFLAAGSLGLAVLRRRR
jgi:hypothetical protein